MSFAELILVLKDILIKIIAAATTAVVAVKGLRSWSRELKGKAEFETARSLALATYKLRDALRECRSPFYDNSELVHYNPAWAGPPDQADANEYAYIYKKRFVPVFADVQQFDSHVLEAEADGIGDQVKNRSVSCMRSRTEWCNDG